MHHSQSVFERYNDQARQVVVLAQEEAREFRHGYIGTEHILLGLLREEDRRPALERPLGTLGITLAGARERIARRVRSGEEPIGSQIPFTPSAKKVLELAVREAQRLGHSRIVPEHILLGMAQVNDGVAIAVLRDFDADAETIRGAAIRTLSDMPTTTRAMREPGGGVPNDAAWFDGLGDVLATLAPEIRRGLAREPDIGDLLLAVACAPETLAGSALRELEVDLDALWGTLERIRQSRKEESDELERGIAELRDQKRQALQDERFQEAARLRDEERTLTEQRRARPEDDVLREVRGRLGLPTSEE